jgi:HD-GYP domain-containing protein (c-di-GMP phosphodiesterase class II)
VTSAAGSGAWPEPGGASATLDPASTQAIEEQRARRSLAVAARDRRSAAFVGGAFFVAAVLLASFVEAAQPMPWVTAALLVVAYALAFRVEFEIGTGTAVPTQLVLVPLLFLVPLGRVPLCVALGIALANLVDLAQGRTHVERVVFAVGVCAWHSVGPVLVLAASGLGGVPRLSHAPVYVAALIAQWAFDFASNALRQWLGSGIPPRALLRPLSWVYVVDGTLAPVGLLAAAAAARSAQWFVLALPLLGLLAIFARERRVRIDHALELSNAYRGTAFLLGDVVEADHAYTGSHSRDVVSLSLAVADALGLDARERRNTEFAALLHDVGKIRIPEAILDKPGSLTGEERALVETHTIEGERMLERVGGLLGEVGHIVRSCHERFDGKGYPDGLVGEAIPRAARIVCCCDALSAMTTDRPYRAALPVEAAIAELRRCAGTHFDPAVVEALAAIASA